MTPPQAGLACALAVALLAGCANSGRKPYANEAGAKNLSIRTTVSGVRAALHVYGVDAQCRPHYLGTLDLGQLSVAVGIPADRWSYLVFDFASSSFLGSKRGRISRDVLLKPRAQYLYEIVATYRDDIYNVVLHERLPHGALRELPLLDLASCQLS